MAIWIEDLETETSTRWRRSDIALVATLAVVMTLQAAVALYVFDFGTPAKAAVTADAPVVAPAPGPETWSTRFTTMPVNADFDGQTASAGPSLWFVQGTAEAHVNFARQGEPLFAPASYAFNAGGMRMKLAEVPTDFRDTTDVAPARPSALPAPTAVAAFVPEKAAPQIQARPKGEFQNVAALRSYLGESGFAEMGARCGNLLGKAYKYDGGLIALCRQVRATL